MDIEFEHLENDSARNQIKLYLERVEQLYTPIKQWLGEENLVVVPNRVDTIEKLATYKVIQLKVKTKAGETLAEIKPTGSKVVIGEGLIEIEGWFGQETLVYMIKEGLQITKPSRKDRSKLITIPMYV